MARACSPYNTTLRLGRCTSLWGLPKQMLDIAVIVTAYRPDDRWGRNYMKRLQT